MIYYFFDINLDDLEDFDTVWLEVVRVLVVRIRFVWMCGDVGLWYFGRCDRGYMFLLLFILFDDFVRVMVVGVVRFRDEIGYEVLFENLLGMVFIGDLYFFDFYVCVCD